LIENALICIGRNVDGKAGTRRLFVFGSDVDIIGLMRCEIGFKRKPVFVLGVPVDLISQQQTLEIIKSWVEIDSRSKEVARYVVTAYSEFFVHAQKDAEFFRALRDADLVVPDGVSVLGAARYYLKLKTQRSGVKKDKVWKAGFGRLMLEVKALLAGFRVGGEIFRSKVGKPVAGVELVRKILYFAPRKKWRVFLLGGFGDTAETLREKVLEEVEDEKQEGGSWLAVDKGIQDWKSASEKEHVEVIRKINRFEPDVLLVAYGPIKQEKWICRYKDGIKAKVIIGVGGSFDELAGLTPAAPSFFVRHGLKWFWRLIVEPWRWKRIWKAVVVFPTLVWREGREI